MDFEARAHEILKSKNYYREDEHNPTDLFKRIATEISKAEETEEKREKYQEVFYQMMANRYFIPSTPCLKNAGNERGLLSPCLVSGTIEDSRKSIFEKLAEAVEFMSWGSGVGYNFSNLRPKGDLIHSNGGESSGPLSFMSVYNKTVGETIKQSAMRPGAQMGVMNDTHPDIWHGDMEHLDDEILDHPINDFINYKRFYKSRLNPNDESSHPNILRRLVNFNISVGISDDFMNAVENDENWDLKFNGKVYQTVHARDMWKAIISSAWQTGDPGLLFLDTINKMSTMNWLYLMDATNPCSELPLPPYGSCNLGHFNLIKFIKNGEFDFNKFKEYIPSAVRFLDNVVTQNNTPIQKVKERNDTERRLGLGYTGLADVFIKLGIQYGSEESVELTSKITKTMVREAYNASIELSKEKGEFEKLDREKFVDTKFAKTKLTRGQRDKILECGIRNCALTTIAPCGTTSQIISASGTGIEPIWENEYKRYDTIGSRIYRVGLYEEWLEENGDVELPKHWVTVSDVPMDEQLQVVAAAQEWIDNSISKTVSLPVDATKEDVSKVYKQAWKLGLKGVTIYRDQSLLSGQVQNKVEPARRNGKAPDRMKAIRRKAKFGMPPENYYINMTKYPNDDLFEVFINSRNEKFASWKNALGRLVSLLLKYGVPPLDIASQLEVIEDGSAQMWKGGRVGSHPALIGRVIREEAQEGHGFEPIEGASICPKCGYQAFVASPNCSGGECRKCGYSACE